MRGSPAIETFLGIGFHVESLEGAASAVVKEAVTEAAFRYVVTPNVQHVIAIMRKPLSVAPFFQSAWRVYCDSRVLSRLARSCGRNLAVVTGSDLTAKVLELANAVGLKIAIVGPLASDCEKLRLAYPRLDIACHTPPIGFIEREQEVAACIAFVKRERAPLVFLAVGMPRQEMLASMLASEHGVRGIGLCIGASIDFLTGKQKRAPRWMQKAGFEWLHRLAWNPIRLGPRYLLECPRIFIVVLRERWRLRPSADGVDFSNRRE
jgi:exopolysaccharide biosynthesis WecB/TagA/CpsF family protein